MKVIIFTLLILNCIYADNTDDLTNRVVNGIPAEFGDFPFIVSIRFQNRHVCGGTIVNEKHILTAAHCVYQHENMAQYFSIQYGVLKINEKEPNVIGVKKIIAHKEYKNENDYPNDIAILELRSKIKIGENIGRVELPTKFNLAVPDSEAEVSGWGLNETGGHLHTTLQKATIKIFSEKKCGEFDKYYNITIHICAGLPLGGAGQCTGDSGGPLTIDKVQYGIVSWSRKPCASMGHPGYFTEVAQYRDWIFNITGN